MRRIERLPLPSGVRFALGRRQVRANRQRREPGFNATRDWKNARDSAPVRAAEATLTRMAGLTERCMYCEDSHGTDIEHFWPKTPFSECLFIWPNMLLCCAECGRLKGQLVPADASGAPLLIDPTAEDPWAHLDFDPDTGNVVARFLREENGYSPKGEKTVEVLHLDRREALARVYRRSFLRIAKIVAVAVDDPQPDSQALLEQLRECDDSGLLSWCLRADGQHLEPFCRLRTDHPEVWRHCCECLS
ncbi:hypothetical protein [Thiohalocapsa halophila]|nr:hypothetical protein [Thiohalocapsa halophila]